ncbi:MAG: aminopeptidase [Sulfobacillus benefaciens]|uniref:Aminopeptidase n=1 Tax=Sulfobacillus benefaciens TaxID=453960 RepID=A0A2T2XL06_9FIRM|nr:MAG: aminopeptidase [Sulfobacillus benefaciens]
MTQVAIKLSEARALTAETLAHYQKSFHDKPEQKTVMNAIMKNGIAQVAIDHEKAYRMSHTFSHEIETGPVTNQKQSGRCWLFAGLNVLRVDIARKLNLKEFELSQSYLMFWDKVEKANYFLESILDTLSEPTDGRLVSWLLSNPMQDGGQWDMFVNLVKKYGVLPKTAMPESFHSSQSMMMNRLLTAKLRQNAARLRQAFHAGQSETTLRDDKEAMMAEFYRMACHFLGEPPTHFDFEYRDVNNQYHSAGVLTPQIFYQKYVDRNLDDFISVINAPTADKPFQHMYTVQYLGNVVGGRPVRYLNVDIDTLRTLAQAQLMDNEPVWFGCDVGKMADRERGSLDPDQFDLNRALDVEFSMTKAERLDYGDSQMTHAMVFTGVNLVDGFPNRWKVENSWGTEVGNKGFYVMSQSWFDEYMYQVVVDKKYLNAALRAVLDEEPKELAPWDPMGSLA